MATEPRITRTSLASWTLAAVVLVAALVLALTVDTGPTGAPTDAPSGERAYPCAEDDRACNEWIDVQESEEGR
jgi:hypothetical protein